MVKRARVVVLVLAVLAPAAASPAAQPGSRIIGGTPAAAGKYPHQAFVMVDFEGSRAYCGGSLIASRHVLTAGHCLAGPEGAEPQSVAVILGEQEVRWSEGPPSPADFPPESRYDATWQVHPGFDPGARPNFDVTVLTLPRPAPQEQVRLPRPSDAAAWAPGVTGTALGWGTTESGTASHQLLEVDLPLIGDSTCAAGWPGEGPGFIDGPRMLCAAGDQGRDTCAGDSGGPLLVPDGPRRMLAGIVSFGANPCASGPPGVYTELGDQGLNDWVRERVPLVEIDASDDDPEPGQAVDFTAASRDHDTFAWDVDGDGFDDGTGPRMRHVVPAGPFTVAVRAARTLRDGAEIRRRTLDVRLRTPVEFAASAISVTEGDAAVIGLLKRGAGAGSVTAIPTTGTAAIGGVDVGAAAPLLVAFADAEGVRQLVVPTVEDGHDEPDETFTIDLSAPAGDLILGPTTRVTVTLLDDDVRTPRLRHASFKKRRATFAVDTAARIELRVHARGTKRLLARAAPRAFTAGRHRLTVRLTAAGRRALRARRGVPVALEYRTTVTGSPKVFTRRVGRATLRR